MTVRLRYAAERATQTDTTAVKAARKRVAPVPAKARVARVVSAAGRRRR